MGKIYIYFDALNYIPNKVKIIYFNYKLYHCKSNVGRFLYYILYIAFCFCFKPFYHQTFLSSPLLEKKKILGLNLFLTSHLASCLCWQKLGWKEISLFFIV